MNNTKKYIAFGLTGLLMVITIMLPQWIAMKEDARLLNRVHTQEMTPSELTATNNPTTIERLQMFANESSNVLPHIQLNYMKSNIQTTFQGDTLFQKVKEQVIILQEQEILPPFELEEFQTMYSSILTLTSAVEINKSIQTWLITFSNNDTFPILNIVMDADTDIIYMFYYGEHNDFTMDFEEIPSRFAAYLGLSAEKIEGKKDVFYAFYEGDQKVYFEYESPFTYKNSNVISLNLIDYNAIPLNSIDYSEKIN